MSHKDIPEERGASNTQPAASPSDTDALAFIRSSFQGLFEDEPPLLKTPKTVQLLVLRQTHDYTIFRTEETRELNVVALPRTLNDSEQVLKVVMHDSKQRAPESRLFAALAKQLATDHEVKLSQAQRECYLKDNLCRVCPRCILFGAVLTKKGSRGEDRWNIKHRVQYNSAFSVEPYEQVAEFLTFNAVSDVTQSTGSALGSTEVLQPLVNLPSVITLNSVTAEELLLFVKTLLACRSYGAEVRGHGSTTNHLLAIMGGYEEVITSLEFSLEWATRDAQGFTDGNAAQTNSNKQAHAEARRAAEGSTSPIANPFLSAAKEIVERYKKDRAVFPEKVKLLGGDELNKWIEQVRNLSNDREKELIERLYNYSSGIEKRLKEAAQREAKKEVLETASGGSTAGAVETTKSGGDMSSTKSGRKKRA